MQSFFNNLFHKKTSRNSLPAKRDAAAEQQTSIDSAAVTYHIEEPARSLSLIKTRFEAPQLMVGVAQSIGIQRDRNEDALFTITTNLLTNNKTIKFGLYIIADGMGGHANGELASSLAVEKLTSHVIDKLYLPTISTSDHQLDISLQEVMQSGVKHAHQSIREIATGGGTTLTAALIMGDLMTIAHVGDSRAYFVDPDGNLQLLTHDHSLVKRLEEIGQISAEQASVHPNRNLLYRALGQGEPFDADITSFQVCQGYELMICSDGLWGVLPENSITAILRSSSEPQLVCQSLIHAANAAGGPDNISVIIVRFPE